MITLIAIIVSSRAEHLDGEAIQIRSRGTLCLGGREKPQCL